LRRVSLRLNDAVESCILLATDPAGSGDTALPIAPVSRDALDFCHRWLIFKKFDNVGDTIHVMGRPRVGGNEAA
jgi:hypothetical protein